MRIMQPPPIRTADQWADEHRILPQGSPEPGLWRTSRVPYTKAIYEAFSDPRYSTIVGVMGSQMSKTEIIQNVIGHRFCDGPYVPTIYIGPTEKNVRSMSRDRIMRMIRSTPDLWERLAKGQFNKVSEKWIAGIRLGFAWAGSATELASHPAGLVLVDERDRMLSDVRGEGDPVELARARGSNYWGFKLGVFSTPTLEGGSPIWSLYEEGTMQKWAWPCIHCHEYFVPTLASLIYPSDASIDVIRRKAIVACPLCGGEMETKHRQKMNAEGQYLPHALGPNREHIAAAQTAENSTASYWASGLCSPWQSFGQRAEALARAYRSHEAERIQGVVNTGFGELYKIRGDAPPWEDVLAARDPTLAPMVWPDWGQMLTLGVDVQKNGLYYVMRVWGFNNRSHLYDRGFIHGETEYDDVWLLLRRLALLQHTNGKPLIACGLIDSGYSPGADKYRRPDHMVYKFCRFWRGRLYPSKGHDVLDRPIKANKIDVTSGGVTYKGGLTLWHINTDHIKSWLYSQIRIPESVDRLWTVHSEIDEDYCRQMVSEEVVVKPSGKRVWIRHGANHYLDAEIMARAAAMIRQVHTLKATGAKTDAAARATVAHDDDLAVPPELLLPAREEKPFVRRPPSQSFFSKYRR